MTHAIAFYSLLTVVLAAFVATHSLALLCAMRRDAGLARPWRMLAWVPPLTAVALARAGHRRLALGWSALALAYLALLFASG